MVCLQYRVHEGESDLDARRRILSEWVKRDDLFDTNHKYFLKLVYDDSKRYCDVSHKSLTYKRKEDFPLVDVPVPGCQNVWFVKWEKLP
jgi:hypothetical protein